jgi:hypothetical protein
MRLAERLRRQTELLGLLDISKDEAGTHKVVDAMTEAA